MSEPRLHPIELSMDFKHFCFGAPNQENSDCQKGNDMLNIEHIQN